MNAADVVDSVWDMFEDVFPQADIKVLNEGNTIMVDREIPDAGYAEITQIDGWSIHASYAEGDRVVVVYTLESA
jgi:hypothetical protein